MTSTFPKTVGKNWHKLLNELCMSTNTTQHVATIIAKHKAAVANAYQTDGWDPYDQQRSVILCYISVSLMPLSQDLMLLQPAYRITLKTKIHGRILLHPIFHSP